MTHSQATIELACRRAYDVAEHLSTVIGPRPAASASERAALDYVESRFAECGAVVHHLLVSKLPTGKSPQRILSLVMIIPLLVVVYYINVAPLAVILYVPVLHFLPPRINDWVRKRSASPSVSSYNVIADVAPLQELRGTLIIGAHIDTAGARLVPHPAFARLQRAYSWILARLVAVLAGLGLVKLLADPWVPLPIVMWSGLRWMLLILTVVMVCFKVVYLLVTRRSGLSPGANDNGTGVGVVLSACEHLAADEQRLRHLRLRWAAWTAEERGLVGSSAYARHADLDPESTWVLNLDMVGTGASMSLVRGVGILPFRRTSESLNHLLAKSLPSIQRVNYFARSSDFKPFLLRGIPAASLTGKGGRRNWYYHSLDDTMDHVQRDLLEQAWQAVVGLATLLDEELSRSGESRPGESQSGISRLGVE